MPQSAGNIHIAASCDDRYAQPLGVMLYSLLRNAREPQRIEFHLIDAGIGADNLARLQELAQRWQARLRLVPVQPEAFAGLPRLRYGTAMYSRIMLPALLERHVRKVIYLDADTVVLGEIEQLWQVSLAQRPLAAVENLSPSAHRDADLPRRHYFNSGVLLLDLDRWRQAQLHSEVMAFLAREAHRLRYPDQSALNSVLHGQWTRLPLVWNQQSDIFGVYRKHCAGCGYDAEELRRAMAAPAIVHFTGPHKPWLLPCYHPFAAYYRACLARTPWTTAESEGLLARIRALRHPRKLLRQYRHRPRHLPLP